MTYAALDAVFLVVSGLMLALAIAAARDQAHLVRRWWPAVVVAGAVLILLTALFDGLMIASGLMRYGQTTTSGLRIGLVPIEDFAYPVAGLVLLPAVWLLSRRRSR